MTAFFRCKAGIHVLFLFSLLILPAAGAGVQTIHVWEPYEITLVAQNSYANPYLEVDAWVQLSGPNFNKKIWGFWDGADTFRIRILATEPGTWTYTTGATDSSGKALTDPGLAGKTGTLTAVDWAETDKLDNPNRRGTIRATPNNRAWQYADGTPFFMLAETQWSAATYRLPFANVVIAQDYQPSASNWSFEGAVQWMKKQGYNTLAMIATHPNWNNDSYGLQVNDNANVVIRAGKNISGSDSVCRDMHDENGNRPFLLPGLCKGKTDACADFHHINVSYFRSLDKKIQYLTVNGMVGYMESVRRDHGQTWKTYYAWPGSFIKFLNYFQARYGVYAVIFSLLHFDAADYSITTADWDAAFNAWFAKYGGMPFGQIVTIMGGSSSLTNVGSVTQNPWLQTHTVGNSPKDHGMEINLAACFSAAPPVPCFCNEPYYINFPASNNACGGEIPPANSYRDNYLARAHAYGLVLNGGLAGHVVGTGSRWGDTPGEPVDPVYPKGWETMYYPFWLQAHFLKDFILSEGLAYRNLELASASLSARTAPGSVQASLDGWTHMMRTPDNSIAFVYFENKAVTQTISGMTPSRAYRAQWFNPRSGAWSDAGGGTLTTDASGSVATPKFPNNVAVADSDWAMKLVDQSVVAAGHYTPSRAGNACLIYENHNTMEIRFPGVRDFSVELFSPDGRALMTHHARGVSPSIAMRTLGPGIYLLRVRYNGGMVMESRIVRF